VTVDQPAKDGRKEILEHYAIGHPFASDIDFDKLAAHTYGFSGAQLEAVMNQAATLAARRAVTSNTQPVITNDDIEEGLSRVISGPAMKSKQMSDKEKKYVAYHEAGHATVQFVLPGCDQVQKISIVSRNIPGVGTAMGYVQSYSEEDSYVPTSEECQDEIAALLAGRASENHFCNVSTAGASDDLQKASKLALRMASDYSFSPDPSKLTELSLAIRGNSGGVQNGSDGYNSDIETAALRFMQVGWKVANDILVANHPVIEAIVGELIANETIDAERIKEIMSENGVEADSWRKEGTDE
jgi:cell division protease FtsH